MTLEQLLAGALGGSPLAIVMGYAVKVLWSRLVEREAQLDQIRSDQQKILNALLNQSMEGAP